MKQATQPLGPNTDDPGDALTPPQRAVVEGRRGCCLGCTRCKGVGDMDQAQCDAAPHPVSLIHGRCPLRKWPAVKGQPLLRSAGPERLLLRCSLCPGDIVTMTAAVRDLHSAHPGRFITGVDTPCPDLWAHNPHIKPVSCREPGVREIEMHYPGINRSNQHPAHFLRGYTDYLEQQLGLTIPTSDFRGDLYLTDEERSLDTPIVGGFDAGEPYWLIVAGGKHDFTAKWWPPDYAQRVVDHFAPGSCADRPVRFAQCGSASDWHPRLRGVTDLVGKTDLRQLIRLVYHAEGVLCPVTLAMHLAAAVPRKGEVARPCVVVAGGREPAHWEAYPGHEYLDTIGRLPCCATGGCWKSRCQVVGDGDVKDRKNLCERPVQVSGDLRIAECMTRVTPARVIDAIERCIAQPSLPLNHGVSA